MWVPVKTIIARPNPKYFGHQRGVTLLGYVSDRYTLFHSIVVTGTVRDSLYVEGEKDQLGALGLVVNMIALWNTQYLDRALTRLRNDGYTVREEDVARLSPLVTAHTNMLGRYHFALPEELAADEFRSLKMPAGSVPR